MQVLVRDNNVDQALKALKKKMQREGIFREMKLRGHYEKPSERKAREKAEAIRRARKLARKRLQREGLLPMKPKPTTGPGAGAWSRPVRPAARPPFRLRHRAYFADGAGFCPRRFFGAPGCYLPADDPVSPRHARDHAHRASDPGSLALVALLAALALAGCATLGNPPASDAGASDALLRPRNRT